MNELEAKTKNCPIVSAAALLALSQYPESLDALDSNRKCGGSACMMWRWEDERAQTASQVAERPPKEGFCGLAGKP